jgi:parvulin-like peptidyl-prolyl isomerase
MLVTSPGYGDTIVARVNGRTITMAQLLPPLIDAHGLTTLMTLVQLELAKQAADERHVTVSPDDVVHERKQMLGKLFEDFDQGMDEKIDDAQKAGNADRVKKLQQEKEDGHTQLLEQFYAQQRMTPSEFDQLLQINTYLRKIAEPLLKDKITDEMLHKRFGAKYGEKVKVRHIQFVRSTDALAAKAQLPGGGNAQINSPGDVDRMVSAFSKLASTISKNPQTAALGGELPAFTMTDDRFPKTFKEAAFALKQKGQVSDLVQDGANYHLILLEDRIPPKAVKFESVRQSIYDDLHEEYVAALGKNLRERIAERARETLKIEEPTLARQFKERMEQREAQMRGRAVAFDEARRDQAAGAAAEPEGPAAPGTAPAATQPATAATPAKPATATTHPTAAPILPPGGLEQFVPPTAPAAPRTQPAAPTTAPAAAGPRAGGGPITAEELEARIARIRAAHKAQQEGADPATAAAAAAAGAGQAPAPAPAPAAAAPPAAPAARPATTAPTAAPQ